MENVNRMKRADMVSFYKAVSKKESLNYKQVVSLTCAVESIDFFDKLIKYFAEMGICQRTSFYSEMEGHVSDLMNYFSGMVQER